MIAVNPANLGPEGEFLQGEEDPAVLDLDTFPQKIRAESKLIYDLHASLAGKDLLVTGTLRILISSECAVCLDPFKTEIVKKDLCIHVENIPMEGPYDLTGRVREELLLIMPMRFKCKEDCKGLCTGCGANLNYEKCSCMKKKGKKKAEPVEKTDWSALDQLKF